MARHVMLLVAALAALSGCARDVHLLVVDAESREPLSGVTVELHEDKGSFLDLVMMIPAQQVAMSEQITGDDGRVDFFDVKDKQYFELRKDGYQVAWIKKLKPITYEAELHFARPAEMRGDLAVILLEPK